MSGPIAVQMRKHLPAKVEQAEEYAGVGTFGDAAAVSATAPLPRCHARCEAAALGDHDRLRGEGRLEDPSVVLRKVV